MFACVDARTLPLVMLQSSHVCLVVEDVSERCRDGGHSDDYINSPDVAISFEQLVVHLAQLRRMLVSVVAVSKSLSIK